MGTLTIFDKAAPGFSNLVVEKIASGFKFTEGPAWHPDGYLLFSDIPANKIYQLYPDGRVNVYLENSGFNNGDSSLLSDMIGSNGLALNHDKQIIICQHGKHAIAALDTNKNMNVLTGTYEDRPFNSPNDLVISTDGSIYFTDPPYGLKEQVLRPSVFQPAAGIYRYYNGDTQLLSTDFRYPNGICFSPGEEFLYAGSNHPDEPFIWKYSLQDGKIKNQSVLIEHNADGIKTDNNGRIYLATNEGILVVSPRGKRLALVGLPESPANLAWAEKKFSDMYVTARSSVYRIKNFQ